MAMKMFTNASQAFDGESIAINSDIVASVFELITPDENAKLQMRTVIFGVNGTDWHVKEPYLEVIAKRNEKDETVIGDYDFCERLPWNIFYGWKSIVLKQ